MIATLPKKDILNQAQMQALLTTIQTLTQSLSFLGMKDEDGTPRMRESTIAIENTLTAACERLEAITRDNARWTAENDPEKLPPPHMRLKPTLCLFGEGYLAFHGHIDYLDKSLIGYGATPQLALACFDAMFYGTAPKELVDWIREQFTNENEDQTLDDRRDSSTQEPEIGGENLSGDSPNP